MKINLFQCGLFLCIHIICNELNFCYAQSMQLAVDIPIVQTKEPRPEALVATTKAPLPSASPEATVFQPAVEKHIRKKIVATAFAINTPLQVDDINDIGQGLPREILKRLEKTQFFLPRVSPNLLSYTLLQDMPSLRLIRQVAAEHDAQFVLAGEIRNAGVRTEKKYFGLWKSHQRFIEIEFAVYDGISGAMLLRHDVQIAADDLASVGRDKVFGGAAFYATSYGKAIDSLINKSVELISEGLQTHPALAKIIKKNKDQIILDAGISSGIANGDLVSLISTSDELAAAGLIAYQSKPVVYGVPLNYLGKLAIIQVQQQYSIAEIPSEIKQEQVKVGDWIQFE